jgi:hypothetical protein
MCGSVLLLIGRGGGSTGRRMIVAHLGRVTSYALLGAEWGVPALAPGPCCPA